MPRGDTPSINPLENPFREPKKRKGHEYTGELIEENLSLEARRAYESAGSTPPATTPEPKDAQDLMTQEERAELAKRQAEREHTTNLQEAKRILKKDYLGPEQINQALELNLDLKEVPPIPFSTQELTQAKERNQFLIYRTDRDPVGQPLTGKRLSELYDTKYKQPDNTNRLLIDTNWYQQEPFFTQETSTKGWALVSKDVLPGSTDKDYLQQTELLIQTLQDQTFKDQPLPKEYAEAIAEFESKKTTIASLLQSDWKKASQLLFELKITQLSRQSFPEVLYDLAIYKAINNQSLLPNTHTWTNSRSSARRFVYVGDLSSDGPDVLHLSPDSSYGRMGFVLVRRS